jgi:hypothetical protein
MDRGVNDTAYPGKNQQLKGEINNNKKVGKLYYTMYITFTHKFVGVLMIIFCGVINTAVAKINYFNLQVIPMTC